MIEKFLKNGFRLTLNNTLWASFGASVDKGVASKTRGNQ